MEGVFPAGDVTMNGVYVAIYISAKHRYTPDRVTVQVVRFPVIRQFDSLARASWNGHLECAHMCGLSPVLALSILLTGVLINAPYLRV